MQNSNLGTGIVDRVMRQLHLSKVREAANSLLIGNDTQCLTTQQFKERYIEQANKHLTSPLSWKHPFWTVELMTEVHISRDGWGRVMLTEAGYTEVNPDIWTKVF